MAKSIFNIEQDQLSILNEIESLDGELTPELLEALTVTKENAKTKLNSYCNLIKMKEAEITFAKDRAKYHADKVKSANKLIERLKNVMLDAVKMFGDDGKVNKETGRSNKVLQCEDYNLFTVTGKSLVNEDNEEITADNFDDDRYNRYVLGNKLTSDQFNAIVEVLKTLEVNSILVTRGVDTAKLKDDLLNDTVVSTASLEEDKCTQDQIDASVDAYIILSDSIRIK